MRSAWSRYVPVSNRPRPDDGTTSPTTIIRRDHDNRNISDFHITSDTPLNQTQLAELIAQAMQFPSEETGESNETGDEEALSWGLDG